MYVGRWAQILYTNKVLPIGYVSKKSCEKLCYDGLESMNTVPPTQGIQY